MKNKRKNMVLVIAIGIVISCGIYIGNYYYQGYQYQKQNQSLTKLVKETKEDKIEGKEVAGSIEVDLKEGEPVALDILSEYQTLYEKNKELIGWLTIEGTKIDYPVLQAKDNEYYLKRDFYGEEDRHGSLFLDTNSDILLPTTNFIIYGHNMKDGTMFSALRNYKKESFYQQHNIITFNTIYEKAQYEIVSVFLSQVYLQNQEVFKYYQFIHASSKKEFNEFYNNIKELSLYDTGVDVQYGDTFITLSTCDYTTKDGRLVVVAKKSE